ncbi:filamin [Verrucomicrobiota bacterium]|nr:filamin [Verrucomicrobiota bacterium]
MWTLKNNHSGRGGRGINRAAVIASAVGVLCSVLAPSGHGAASTVSGGDFAKVVPAFFDQHCIECHSDKVQKGDLNLQPFKSPASLLKERKVWLSVLNQTTSGEMPPKKKARPAPADLAAFTGAVHAAMELAENNAKPDPGRVTLRRLNRTEYANTIRDLVGVDFNPAEDFPTDDIGHGFDNIADVLTLSPVLMERYLAAAENIAASAIVVNVPKPPVRRQSSKYLQPAGTFPGGFRATDKGLLFTDYKLSTDGEYVLRARVYGLSPEGTEPVKAAFMLDQRELKTFEVTATQKKPEILEYKFHLEPSSFNAGIKLLNPSPAGELPRMLFVEYIELTGPTDTRPLSHRRIMACTPGKSKAEQTREIVTRFATRAFRRPATAAEIERLVKVVEATEARGQSWEAGIQFAVQAVLISPKFLFRVELDDRPTQPQAHPLDEFQLASRLSYFLWSTMPDDELFELAGKNQLTANLEAQVRRLLKSPKAGALVENFAMQWLQLRRLQSFAPDAKLFPNFTDKLRAAMLRETELFFGEIVREDRSILDLIDADFTYLTAVLARHYGIADTVGNWIDAKGKDRRPGGEPVRGDMFVRVSLPMKERGGLLTQASVLTVTSNPTRTSPVKRGRWVLEQILGTPPPPPPPGAPELDAQKELTGTLRQRMEQHRANPNCASCHTQMDALGFAFENYDAVGAYRKRDGTADIDSSGTLPDGKSFNGPAELKLILKEKKDLLARNLTEKLLIFALGRGLEYYDARAVRQIADTLARSDYKFSALVTGIVKSDPFRMRRGTELSQQQESSE